METAVKQGLTATLPSLSQSVLFPTRVLWPQGFGPDEFVASSVLLLTSGIGSSQSSAGETAGWRLVRSAGLCWWSLCAKPPPPGELYDKQRYSQRVQTHDITLWDSLHSQTAEQKSAPGLKNHENPHRKQSKTKSYGTIYWPKAGLQTMSLNIIWVK